MRGRRDEKDREEKYKYVPSLNTVQLHSKVIRVPRLRIEFSSKEYIYSRVILPASDTTLVDEIAECKHILKKRQTFAVCDVCGVAKCQKDIVADDSGAYFCKRHAPEEAVESKKKGSIRSRFFTNRKTPPNASFSACQSSLDSMILYFGWHQYCC